MVALRFRWARRRLGGSGRMAREMCSVALLALLIIGALGVHFYAYAYPSLARMLIEESERDAMRAAEVLRRLVFDEDSAAPRLDPHGAASLEAVRAALGVARFKIFDAEGVLIHSSSGEGIGTRNTSSVFRDVVAQGKIYTHVVGDEGHTLEGEAYGGYVVESYIPILLDGRFKGAFEIYFDITASHADFDRRVRSMNLSVATLLVVLLTVFLVSVLRSYRSALRLEREHSRRLSAEIEQRLQIEEELRESHGHFRYLAHHDALTGIPNRTLFLDRFEHALANARRYGTRLALLFIDLDRFKPINDTYGHEAGDRILCAAAEILQQTVRESDTAARIAGDEFAVLVEHADERTVDILVERLSRELNARLDLGFGEIATSASIGISVYPEHGQDVETLLHHADLAMYEAKSERRGSWRYFSAPLLPAVAQRIG